MTYEEYAQQIAGEFAAAIIPVMRRHDVNLIGEDMVIHEATFSALLILAWQVIGVKRGQMMFKDEREWVAHFAKQYEESKADETSHLS